MKIYYVEDSKKISDIITKYLIKEGFEVTVFYNGESAMERIDDKVDLWLLDIMLPGEIQGFHLIRKLKENNSNIPVIFTSARDESIDKIQGLEFGADDYIAKPFMPREVILRIKAVLKRTGSIDEIKLGDYIINLQSRTIFNNDKVVRITNKQYKLLLFLIDNKNLVKSREEIIEKLFIEEDNDLQVDEKNRQIDDLVRRLRKKIPELTIETIYGQGYKLILE